MQANKSMASEKSSTRFPTGLCYENNGALLMIETRHFFGF